MQDCDPGGKIIRKGESGIAPVRRISKKKKIVVFIILGVKPY